MSKFSDIIKNDKPTLVDFYAKWCGPCKIVHPILEDLKKQLGTQLVILKIDVDKNPAVANQFKIQSVPTLILFKEGEKIWRESGVIPISTLKAKIHTYL